MKLVVVESPGKVSKLSSILGSDYKVVASIGHCIDLPKNKLGVNIKKNFEPTYTVIPEKKQIIDNIIKLAQTAECCILSSDPDREGEFISYIISTQLPKNTKFSRVTFNSITKNEVLNGMANPRNIDMNLVNAQQSRRILDRLCGYKTSPVAQQFIAGARSAGRVQSAVLRLIVEREEEITNFKPEEYWDPITERCIEDRPRHGKRPLFYKVLIPDTDLARLLRKRQARRAKKLIRGLRIEIPFLET